MHFFRNYKMFARKCNPNYSYLRSFFCNMNENVNFTCLIDSDKTHSNIYSNEYKYCFHFCNFTFE